MVFGVIKMFITNIFPFSEKFLFSGSFDWKKKRCVYFVTERCQSVSSAMQGITT